MHKDFKCGRSYQKIGTRHQLRGCSAGLSLNVNMKKDATVRTIEVHVDGQRIAGDIIKNIQADVKYEVLVKLPL